MIVRRRMLRALVALFVFVAGLMLALQLVTTVQFPAAPDVDDTHTPMTKRTPQELGSFDVLGRVVGADEARALLATEEGRQALSAERGAIAITSELIALGRKTFYEQTFGNEVFATDVVGALDGPLNIKTLGYAILRLAGGHTSNLRVRLERDAVIGGHQLNQGSYLDTGLDVPPGWVVPLGFRARLDKGRVVVGITCALCHSTVDDATGKIIEGAPNNDLRIGAIIALASNSAAMFRNTGTSPLSVRRGARRYAAADGTIAHLPDYRALEDEVDADLMAWPPGSFDSTADIVNNPSQIPSSFTFSAWPYGWSGFASIGWFHGLTTLNNNVHALNSDATTGADSAELLNGIDKELFLGVIFQNASLKRYRLPDGAQPSKHFSQIDPTPGAPGMNRVIEMPDYPRGSQFIPDGLMASTAGRPVAEELNSLSAWQNSLAPPPSPPTDRAELERGQLIFGRAGCGSCHSGRYFTNNRVVAQPSIGTQPSRAKALAAFPRIFTQPRTFAPSVEAPPPPDAPVIRVPEEISPDETRALAYAISDPAGGYKVPSLIGLGLSAPYLHDGGAAAARGALRREGDRFVATDPTLLGLSGTLRRAVRPDPAASLRVLVDRRLRALAVEAHRSDGDLQRANSDGSGHALWVDPEAGFSADDQTALIHFLLSLDDDPELLPAS